MNFYNSCIHDSQKAETTQMFITDEWKNKCGISVQWEVFFH